MSLKTSTNIFLTSICGSVIRTDKYEDGYFAVCSVRFGSRCSRDRSKVDLSGERERERERETLSYTVRANSVNITNTMQNLYRFKY
ncbi:MAG: hypothetical protein [Cressdnaviricota sp.]|nr:MAG: hypothetical protein [Cressdnaviricota sp.]